MTFRLQKEQFIEFWARQVTSNDIGQDKTLYLPNIGKPLTRESLEALFLWKNQMPFSAAKRGLLETYIARCDEINKLSPKTAASDFLEMFNGRAIWRIFLLHCWQPSKYPIYDQHVHRAMKFICEGLQEESSGWSDREKIETYTEEYISFFSSFGSHDPAVDRALWVFGRFIKLFPKFCIMAA